MGGKRSEQTAERGGRKRERSSRKEFQRKPNQVSERVAGIMSWNWQFIGKDNENAVKERKMKKAKVWYR